MADLCKEPQLKSSNELHWNSMKYGTTGAQREFSVYDTNTRVSSSVSYSSKEQIKAVRRWFDRLHRKNGDVDTPAYFGDSEDCTE